VVSGRTWRPYVVAIGLTACLEVTRHPANGNPAGEVAFKTALTRS
jgi:hypothetical protein